MRLTGLLGSRFPQRIGLYLSPEKLSTVGFHGEAMLGPKVPVDPHPKVTAD